MKPFFSIFLLISTLTGLAQVKMDDFGRIVLNTYLPENLDLPVEAKNMLSNKLNLISSNYGLGGSQSNPRFILKANIVIGTKDIIAGPPQMIAQNMDISLFVGDAFTNTIFSNTTLSIKGVGTNENRALIEAFKSINPKNKEIISCLEEGKKKIIEYYSVQCDFLIKDALTLTKTEKYDEAIYQLSLVPEVCESCYFRCLDTLSVIYQKKIDADGKTKLNQAKLVWAAEQNPAGAEKAADLLVTINPMSACQNDVQAFIKTIDAKLKADEKAKWQFKMKQYADKIAAQKEQVRIAEEKSQRDDVYRENQAKRDAVANEKNSKRNYELDKMRVSAYRDVAVEYAKNQPKTVTYNNIFWR